MFAFNTHTLTRLAHVQGIHAWGLPLALLAADRMLVTRRVARRRCWLALWMTAMAYTSGYLIVFASVMVAVVLVARVRRLVAASGPRARCCSRWPRRSGRRSPSLPVYLPYRRVAREQGMVRSLEAVADFSATLTGYLAAAGRIHFSTWSGRFLHEPGRRLLPGLRRHRSGRRSRSSARCARDADETCLPRTARRSTAPPRRDARRDRR